MTFDEAKPFLERQHSAIVTTFRHDGAAQMSIVVAGVMGDGMTFVV